MLKTLTCLFSTLIILSGPTTASACRMYQSEGMKMNRDHDAVIIATITEARYLDTSAPMPSWQAIAELKQTVEGKNVPPSYSFINSYAPEACQYGQPIANIGEDWVLYLGKRGNTEILAVYEAYPLSLARKIDKRFTGQP